MGRPLVLLLALCSTACDFGGVRHIPVDVLPAEPDAAPPDLILAPDLPDAAAPALDARPAPDLAPAPGRAGPPYPVVLAHGFFGFDKVGPLDYWWKVKPALQADGHAVTIAATDPFNTTYVRGEQLLKQVKQVLAKSGAAKVNIVAHSQGGLDARYVAVKLPGQVASVTTLASPHQGAYIADVLLKRTAGWTKAIAEAFLKAFAPKVYGDPAKDTSIKASLEFMATDSVAKFNAKYPDQPGVAYYSIGGRSDKHDGGSTCIAPLAPPFIKKFDKVKDPIEPLLYITAKVLQKSFKNPKPNDGVIETASTKWGTWLGCVPADHFDQVGHLFGDSPGKGNSFDHKQFYRDLLAWLKAQGY